MQENDIYVVTQITVVLGGYDTREYETDVITETALMYFLGLRGWSILESDVAVGVQMEKQC